MKKYIKGEYIELTLEEIAQIQAEQEEFKKTKEYRQIKIDELKQRLAETDYIACKIAEGSATVDEYEYLIKQRRAWRDEINSLEKTEETHWKMK